MDVFPIYLQKKKTTNKTAICLALMQQQKQRGDGWDAIYLCFYNTGENFISVVILLFL